MFEAPAESRQGAVEISRNGKRIVALVVDGSDAYVISPTKYTKAFGKLPTCKNDIRDGDHHIFILWFFLEWWWPV